MKKERTASRRSKTSFVILTVSIYEFFIYILKGRSKISLAQILIKYFEPGHDDSYNILRFLTILTLVILIKQRKCKFTVKKFSLRCSANVSPKGYTLQPWKRVWLVVSW